jgi:probable aminopeptidase NPEPL1
MYSGKTVEISNCDAEGRLVLALGMAHATKHMLTLLNYSILTLLNYIILTLLIYRCWQMAWRMQPSTC